VRGDDHGVANILSRGGAAAEAEGEGGEAAA
jgi:hypothetical protein